MNIFYVDRNPFAAASMLCDKHIPKMLLESCQMLCTALHYVCKNEGVKSQLYKPAYDNHPCTVWTREAKENFEWLLHHAMGLNAEYILRFNKTHKCHDMLRIINNIAHTEQLKWKQEVGTAPAQAMPDKYKHHNFPVKAYRNFYFHEKKFAKWEKPTAQVPGWYLVMEMEAA